MASDPGAIIGIMGGSGLYDLDMLDVVEHRVVETPFGQTSAPVIETRTDDHRVFFLPRHGIGHTLLPAEVPYAANIYALKSLGATHILSMSAVGSLREQYPPGSVVLPDQFIDWTRSRTSTFYGNGVVGHAGLADPICDQWHAFAHRAAQAVVPNSVAEGTYVCIEGPQFSTRAESNLYRSWGADIIGMTNATEAKLAREAAICYASICFVTDYDCWKTDVAATSVEQVLAVMHANVDNAKHMIAALLKQLSTLPACALPAPENAIVTAPEHRHGVKMAELAGLLEH